VVFGFLAAVGVAFLVLGVMMGNPETIHRFAAQI
jgi:hypothetical protein